MLILDTNIFAHPTPANSRRDLLVYAESLADADSRLLRVSRHHLDVDAGISEGGDRLTYA